MKKAEKPAEKEMKQILSDDNVEFVSEALMKQEVKHVCQRQRWHLKDVVWGLRVPYNLQERPWVHVAVLNVKNGKKATFKIC